MLQTASIISQSYISNTFIKQCSVINWNSNDECRGGPATEEDYSCQEHGQPWQAESQGVAALLPQAVDVPEQTSLVFVNTKTLLWTGNVVCAKNVV